MIKRNNSHPEDYHKQVNNERSPFVTCFPTSMINASEVMRIQLPPPVPGVDDMYKQSEDRYDVFLHSDWVEQRFANDSSVQALLRDDYDYREIYAVQEAAFNQWVGYQACKFINGLTQKDIKWIIDQGGTVVTSGRFCKFAHVVNIVGYVGNDDGSLTHIIIDDSYGNPLQNYKPLGVGGNDVEYPVNDFWKATEKDGGNHFGIVFLPKGVEFKHV